MIRHGTTITTNALLTGKCPPVGLVTTKGFRDTLALRQGLRENVHDPRSVPPPPLVPRHLCLGVTERVDYNGNVLIPLDEAEVETVARQLRAAGVQSVAVCFLHSYTNPDHEQRARQLISAVMPDASVVISREVLPEIKFYERLSTTVFTAMLAPILDRYLEQLQAELQGVGFTGAFLLMQANGGMTEPEIAVQKAALSLESGPAGGVRAGLWFADLHRVQNAISLDMGGTSCDVTLLWEGSALTSTEKQVQGYRIGYPVIDVHSVGAGGGSYVWVDQGGFLRVGPDSAGAVPGPACYDRGGTRPTITDVNLVLGYLDPERFAGGSLRLDPAAAKSSLERWVAKPLGLTTVEAAWGAYQVVNTNMAGAIREVSVNRGHDPSEFLLVAGGGTAGCHAASLASEMHMPAVLVPRQAPGFSAVGLLLSDIRHDFVRTFKTPVLEADPGRLARLVAEMRTEAETALAASDISPTDGSYRWTLEMHYIGQVHEVEVQVPEGALTDGPLESVVGDFHAAHRSLYGYDSDEAVEMTNLRLAASRSLENPPPLRSARSTAPMEKARLGTTDAYLGPMEGSMEVPQYNGEALSGGHIIPGPCIVLEPYTTIVVPSNWEAAVDAYGNFLLFDVDHRQHYLTQLEEMFDGREI